MGFQSNLKIQGELKAKKSWYRLFHVRMPFGRLWFTRDKGEGWAGIQLFNTHLTAEVRRADGSVAHYDLGSGLITNAGMNYLAAQLQAQAVPTIIYHDSGTGTTAAAVTDTALQTPTGIARTSGTQTNSNNTFTTKGNITYNGTYAITEWGLFSASAVGTLWDRRVFAPINVSNTDQITFTYTITFPSGG